jgi:erythromycin esterase-like protein
MKQLLIIILTGHVLDCDAVTEYNETDFQPFVPLLENISLSTVGESAHRLGAVHPMVTRLFRCLVERQGSCVLVLESASWAVDDDGTRDFLVSNRTKLTGNEHFLLNAFASKFTTDLLLWIRQFNRHNRDNPIRLAGYQPEQPVSDLRALKKLLSTSNDALNINACKAVANRFSKRVGFHRIFE